jgi:hypothetical protein
VHQQGERVLEELRRGFCKAATERLTTWQVAAEIVRHLLRDRLGQ